MQTPGSLTQGPMLCGRTPLKRMWVVGAVAVCMLVSSCRNQDPPNGMAARASASGPQDPNLTVRAGGYHGRHFAGPVYVPRASLMEDGTAAYNVTYQKGVTVISKDDTLRHLVTIQADGSYVFDSSAEQIAKVKPGGVLLLSGLALCTVLDLKKISDGYVLKTEPAKLTDAIKEGRLEGTYHIDFSRMQNGKSSARGNGLPASFSPFGAVYAARTETTATQGVADFDVDFSGYNYHVKFLPANDRLAVQAIIKFGGDEGTLAYEGVGYLSNFVSTIRMQIKDGKLTRLDFINSNFNGQVELKWFAVANDALKAGSIPQIPSWPAELLKSAPLAKAAYHVPILLGPLPFDLRISLGFSFIPAFTTKNSVIEGSKLVAYRGSGGFTFIDGHTSPSGAIQVQGNVTGHDNRVVSGGPVGFSGATEAPRVELAMGWPPTLGPAAGYLNFIGSYGIVTNGIANPAPCQTNIMAFSVNAGAAYTSPNSFADWYGLAAGATSSVSIWQKTFKSAGPSGTLCPN